MGPSLTTSSRRGGVATMPGRNKGQHPPNYGLDLKPKALSLDEVDRLLRAFSRRSSTGIRNAALTSLQVRSGVRIGEALKAPLSDLDLDARTFYVRFPKRDRKGRLWPRTVGLQAETVALLERWLERRRKLGIRASAPLFCQVQQPRRGLAMARSGYGETLKHTAARAGITKRVHPHALRHTFAYQWVERGDRLDLLQRALGHRNLATTDVYVSHANPKAVLDAMRAERVAAASTPDLEAVVRTVLAELAAGGDLAELVRPA